MDALKKKNQGFFDRIKIPFYEISDSPVQEFFHRKLTYSFTRFLGYVPLESVQNKRVLDAGCNDGYFFDLYEKWGAKGVVGYDISIGPLLRGMRRKHGILRKNGHCVQKIFIQGDLECVAFQDKSFDSIFCFGTWHHIVKRDTFLKECYRVLKENGFLILSDPNELQPFRGIVNRFGVKMKVLIEEEFHVSPEFTQEMLEKHGFKKIKRHCYNVFSESASRFCGVLLERKSKWFYMFSVLFLLVALMDAVFEKTVLRLFPNFAWSYIIICKKVNSPLLKQGQTGSEAHKDNVSLRRDS